MLALNEKIYPLSMANNVHWHGHVQRKIELEIKGQRKKVKVKRICEKQVEKQSMTVCLNREAAIC